jgi:hypothetical protein
VARDVVIKEAASGAVGLVAFGSIGQQSMSYMVSKD